MIKGQFLVQLKQDLLISIPNAVKRIKLDEGDKVCYIALYGSDDEPVIGLIQLGVESYRKQMIEEEGTDDKWLLWNFGEMPVNYQIGLESEDPNFPEKQNTLIEIFGGQEEYEEWWEVSQNLRFEIAYELNNYDWSGIIPTSDDFVIYSSWEAIDVINGDLTRSIPKNKYELLESMGLI
ncbi:hypothetical protein [Cohnella herbarum]|uniref:DUF4303 domain-containing protein n=3 Tax=Cohnella herbarum TaxID=2728023 RepID=A0A7Z2ZKY9_9BACL|nr:hypothetical protein [Cohnella herbarum]QJD83284.1 hypothetical protein HH215_08945 [Cohnella herbarum]